MKIARNAIVSFDYTLTDDDGEVLDTSSGGEPLRYLHGYGQIVPGLERQLEGRMAGDSLQISVPPAEGYGEHDPAKVVTLPRANLPAGLEPEIGMQLAAEGPRGEHIPLWITDFSDDQVTVDANHPLAGRTLHFQIDVREVREATREELEHGHVHGPGGHGDHD